MRHIILIIMTASLLYGCGAGDVQLRVLNADSVALKALRGKWLVLNYWAAWCKPCLEEIPELNALQAAHSDAVVVAAVNFDNPGPAALAAAAHRFGIRYTVLAQDPAADLGYPRPQQLPTTIIFSPEGMLHATRLGPQTAATLAQSMGLVQAR